MRLCIYASVLTLSGTFVFASEPLVPVGTDHALTDLLTQSTNYASQHRYNVDYQPYILSVWQSDDLKKFGVRTLAEAIELIPGIDFNADNTNNRTTVVRGSNPLGYGQTKLVIDGVLINDRTFDNFNAYLDFPLELIERIEIVRGSGSFVEGINGYAGTIHITTHSASSDKKSYVWGGVNNDQGGEAGFLTHLSGQGWNLALDAFRKKNTDESPYISRTFKDKNGQELTQTQHYAPLGSDYTGAGVKFSTEAFTFVGRVNNYISGSAFGNFYFLPNDNDTQKNPSYYADLRYTYPMSAHLQSETTIGLMRDTWESHSTVIPQNYYTNGLSFPIPYHADLVLKNLEFHAKQLFTYTGWNDHTISVSLKSKWEDTISISETKNYPFPSFFKADLAKRQSTITSLTDYYTINDQWALITMLGGTQANDQGFFPYGRASVVYQPNRHNIFKVMAGNSLRLPSWQELYVVSAYRNGNLSLKPETTKSIEGQYIYKPTTKTTLSLNTFYRDDKDQIILGNTTIYQNMSNQTIYGLEAELRGSLSARDQYTLSATSLNGHTHMNGVKYQTLFLTSKMMLKAAYAYDVTDQLTLSSTFHYDGPRDRQPGDPRSDFKAYNTLDLSAMYHYGRFSTQVMIKNIADHSIKSPAPLVNGQVTYNNDYPTEGRSIWLKVGVSF